MGTRKTIYIKDAGIWAEIKAEAKRLDRSVSWYLVNCHENQGACRDSRKEADLEKEEILGMPIKKVGKVAEAEFSGGYSKGEQVGREK